MTRLKDRNVPGKERIRSKKVADVVQGNAKKPGQDTSLTWLNMIERSQNKKQNKDTQLGRQTNLHTTRSEN
jgi:hypothetical protein